MGPGAVGGLLMSGAFGKLAPAILGPREDTSMAFTNYHLFFDDMAIGQQWESGGRTITEADIINFAGISGDFNPIHIDHEFARTTAFRKPIAHGLLVFSIGSGLSTHCPPTRTLAFLGIKDWQFTGPVFIGDTIRITAKVVAKEERSRGRRAVITWQRQILNQAGKVVQQGTTQTLVEGRAARKEESDEAAQSEPAPAAAPPAEAT